MKRSLLLLLLLSISLFPLFSRGKEDADSLVRLLSATSAKQKVIDGESFRIVEGPARFLHNDTYLICDTARWNVDKEYIDAIGHVQIIQENTQLTGDRIHYLIKDNTAQFRGTLVELTDKDHNTLRTKHLDYNTKDSVALFFMGASMKDKDGNIIESLNGRFESKINKFTFKNKVEMYSDSLYVITDSLHYFSNSEYTYFFAHTKAWKDDNYLSADGGWYDKKQEKLFFQKDVYIQTKDNEAWCQKLLHHRNSKNTLLEEDIQLYDTDNKSFVFGGKLDYVHSPKYITVEQNPVFASIQEDDQNKPDTVFVVGDLMKSYSIRMCDIDSATVAAAKERKELSQYDPLLAAKKNMSDNAAKANSQPNKPGSDNKNKGRQDQGINDQNNTFQSGSVGTRSGVNSRFQTRKDNPPEDDYSFDMMFQEEMQNDTIPQVADVDTLLTPDSLDVVIVPEIPDTSMVNFVEIYHNVKIFRKDMQVLCDSLIYTGIDSIARLYKNPILWHEIKNQLTADSMQIVIENQKMTKGNLLSNAFVASQEDSIHFDQIKSPEMVGYFNNNKLSRFDALGGISALLFLSNSEEIITTLNKKESKLLSATFKDGTVQKVLYLENLKQDILPLYEVPESDLSLKDFEWRGDERPKSRFDITKVSIKKSKREEPLRDAFPKFPQTAVYFPEEFILLRNTFEIDNK